MAQSKNKTTKLKAEKTDQPNDIEQEKKDINLITASKEDSKYILDKPIEENKESFNTYFEIYAGESDMMIEGIKDPELNKEVAYYNMVRCIRVQIRPENSKVYPTHQEATETAELFVKDQIKNYMEE